MRIFWPRERCSLLRDDVVFVDSPGVDVSPNLNDWIDNHCLNADVFVLVLNAESTMTLAVSQLHPSPYINVFVISVTNILFWLKGEALLSRGVEATVQTEHLRIE